MHLHFICQNTTLRALHLTYTHKVILGISCSCLVSLEVKITIVHAEIFNAYILLTNFPKLLKLRFLTQYILLTNFPKLLKMRFLTQYILLTLIF